MTRPALLLAAAALAASLAACGKMPAQLDPPGGGKTSYPRPYPSSG